MGRRKKEPEFVHRNSIAAAAQRLFQSKGIAAATMDDIAREAGYSKATLYVYFQNKDEIVNALALESMKKLHGCLSEAIAAHPGPRAGYFAICDALARYQEAFPFYFEIALGEITAGQGDADRLPVERALYEVGEEINRLLARFIDAGIDAGEFCAGIDPVQTAFVFWAALGGLIRMADKKQPYIEERMGLSKRQFLEAGYRTLYRAVAQKPPEIG